MKMTEPPADSTTQPTSQYRQLLRSKDVKTVMASISMVKFSHAIMLLGLLLAVNDARGAALGGIAVAVYVLAGSVMSPIKAFLMEHFGMTQVLLPLSILTMLAHILLAVELGSDTIGLLGLAAVCGATWPHCSAMPIWQTMLPEKLLPTAAATDSILTSLAYTTGSLMASVLATIDFRLVIAFPAMLAMVGIMVLVSLSATQAASIHHQSKKGVIPRNGWTLACLAFGVYLALDSLIVLSATHSGPAYAGIMSAMLIGTSAISSFYAGRSRQNINNRTLFIYALVLALCGVLVCIWAFADAPLFLLAFVLALFGWARSPLLIAANTKIVEACPVAPYRAFALQSISITVGAATGNAAGGLLGAWAGISIIVGAVIAVIACSIILTTEGNPNK